MQATINVPIWYAGLAAVALPAVGWLAAALRLNRQRDEVKGEIAELKRLTDWTPVAEPREAGSDPWPEPLSPRVHERATVTDAAPALDLAPTEAIVGAHAAPAVEPDWYRNESDRFTRGWWIEQVARIASIGHRPRLVEHVPAHAAWNLPTGEFDEQVAKLVETETKRQESAFARAVHQLMDDVVHMGGVR